MSEPIQHIEDSEESAYGGEYDHGLKRKLKVHWSCSDKTHHEHRYKWTAWLCGKIQKLIQ